MLLIGSTFDLWHGLFAARPFYGPLALAALVSILWITACLSTSWWLLRHRDFAGTHVTRRAGWVRPVRLVAITVSGVALLALAGNWGPPGVTAARLQASLTPAFNNISLLQQRLIGRVVPAAAKLDVVPYCTRHSGPRHGPGDWSCTLNVFIPQPGKLPFQETPVTYDVSVQANGCYKAQSPPRIRRPADDQRRPRTDRGQSAVRGLRLLQPAVSGPRQQTAEACSLLPAASVIVTRFGNVNALTPSIVDCTRDIGAVRAIGMTRSQRTRIVPSESERAESLGRRAQRSPG